MAAKISGAAACLPLALALALLISPAGAQGLGGDGPDAAGSAADANAYIELLKSSPAYQGMGPEQR